MIDHTDIPDSWKVPVDEITELPLIDTHFLDAFTYRLKMEQEFYGRPGYKYYTPIDWAWLAIAAGIEEWHREMRKNEFQIKHY